MTDDGATGPATGPPSPADFAGQLRAAADRLMAGWTAAATPGAAAVPGLPAMPAMPTTMPATMSARQMDALLEDLAARRAQVQALITQLEAFDGQLGSLEANLRPLVEWTRSWANAEGAIADFWRPLSGPPAGGSPG